MKSTNKSSAGGTKLYARIIALLLAGLMVAGAAYYVIVMIAGLM